jgi:hypothetical protein
MATKTYQAIEVRQQPDAPSMYMISASAGELLEWCDVPGTKEDYMAGYQRVLTDKRVEEIGCSARNGRVASWNSASTAKKSGWGAANSSAPRFWTEAVSRTVLGSPWRRRRPPQPGRRNPKSRRSGTGTLQGPHSARERRC